MPGSRFRDPERYVKGGLRILKSVRRKTGPVRAKVVNSSMRGGPGLRLPQVRTNLILARMEVGKGKCPVGEKTSRKSGSWEEKGFSLEGREASPAIAPGGSGDRDPDRKGLQGPSDGGPTERKIEGFGDKELESKGMTGFVGKHPKSSDEAELRPDDPVLGVDGTPWSWEGTVDSLESEATEFPLF